ncbi:uncharacterized protein EHS24_004827 [Apiotrichum porosum]|uniref:Uncharacterized protein n=1 Tax=Apiotrichum porosum TaxID=105984 RepID=A0A427Y644_9TREE|nr:uncharacterized protein EHS24_004827 [Apiotrichum porosum]RSH86558.1 hypothetical protein EHS24_004827 [Apiotrichum porosum]
MAAVSFTYTVAPPAGTPEATFNGSPVPTSSTITAPVAPAAAASDSRSPTDAFYAAAAPALRAAQLDLMDALSSWKDSVGDREKAIENVKVEKGKGKAARMMMATKAADAEESDDEDEDEDGDGSEE